MAGRLIAVEGATFGSEAKGVVADLLAGVCQAVVSANAPQAGHTIYYHGKAYVGRNLPVGWTNPHALVFIAAGALVNVEVLMDEISQVADFGFPLQNRLFIHENVAVVDHRHEEMEHAPNEDGQDMFQRLGSTREGVGAAMAERVTRSRNLRYAKDVEELKPYVIGHREYLNMLHGLLEHGGNVLLEGHQGYKLSLYHGVPPFTTSRDTSVAALVGECGFSPMQVTDVVSVDRSFPIRVAGNSGPFRNETSWENLNLEPEITTVTKRVRRVAYTDWELVRESAQVNRPNHIALTHMDYLPKDQWPSFVATYEAMTGAVVSYLGYGKTPEDSLVTSTDELFVNARAVWHG